MARPRVHDDDATMDAARRLVLEGGGAATTAAISARSGAPIGSLYHRFGSRADLLAELWVRTVRRFQAGLLEAVGSSRPGLSRAVAAAGWVISFASRCPDDARLLLICRREELLGTALGAMHAAELRDLNRPVESLIRQIADEIYGQHDETTTETVLLAVMDLPYAAVRRHLRAGTDPAAHRDQVLAGVRAILAAQLAPTGSSR